MPEESAKAMLQESDESRPWHDGELLEKLYVENQMSANKISDLFDCSMSTVTKYLGRHGIEKRTRSEAAMAFRGTLNHVPFQTHPRGHELWWTSGDGTHKQVYVHRLLAVAEYGVEAVAASDVHHINGIPWDNRPENIELLTHGEHSTKHGKMTWLDKLRATEMYREGASSYDLAPVFNVTQGTIINAVREAKPDAVRGHGGR